MGSLLRFPGRRRARGLDLATLYTRHGGMVLRRIRRFFPGEEAEEVMHEVFLRALEKQDTFRGEASPTTWLYQLTTRHCLNRLRDRTRRREALAINAELPWLAPAPAPDQIAQVFLEQLWRSLDEETAMVAVLYYVDGMSHAEIAEVIGVSRRTVGNRLEALRLRAKAAAGQEVAS